MAIHIIKKTDLKELEKVFLEAFYSGERFILQREDGLAVGIVPVEDMNILEQIDSPETVVN